MDEKNKFQFSLWNFMLMMVPLAIAAFALRLVGMPSAIVAGTIGICSAMGALFAGLKGMLKGFLYGVPLGLFVLFMVYAVAFLLVGLNVIDIEILRAG